MKFISWAFMKVMFAPQAGRDLEECRHNNPQPARTFGDTPPDPGYITFMFYCEIHFMGLSSNS